MVGSGLPPIKIISKEEAHIKKTVKDKTKVKEVIDAVNRIKGNYNEADGWAKLELNTKDSSIKILNKDEIKKPFNEEDYKKAYEEQSTKLKGAFVPATNTLPSMSDVYGSDMFYANQGGLATAIPKYNQGGINYLPSKIDHNENDVNNYVRAEGYVEDGAGAGDKDEDTMLAQLADGEFVSRADAVLGAGILSGADPKSFKGMRKAGANFFYDQQKKFKRIYDLVNASKPN